MIPHYMASLWGSYTFQQGLLQSFILGSGIRYTGTSYGNNTEMFKVPAYNLYDLMAHYNLGEASSALKGTTVQFNVNNLTNKSTTSPPAAEPQRASTAPAVRCSLWSATAGNNLAPGAPAASSAARVHLFRYWKERHSVV